MSKRDDKFAPATFAGVAVATADEKEPEATPETTVAPEVTPEVTPEITPEPVTAAPAETIDNRVTIMTPTLISQSSEVKRVAAQLEDMRDLAIQLRSSIHHMIGQENRRGMTMGQQLFFAALAHGTFDIQGHVTKAQEVLRGQATLDNEGDVVTD